MLAALALAIVCCPVPALADAPYADPPALEQPELELAARERFDQARGNVEAHHDPLIDNAVPQPMPGYAAGGGWVAPHTESPWLHLPMYGNVFYWTFGGPQYFNPPPPDPPGPGAKNGMLQRVILTETFLADGNDPSAMGVNDIELKTVLALPLGCLATPLLITPGFGAHYFNGPQTTDVPAHVYETYLDVRWMRQVSQCVGIDVAVTPGWYSDFEQSNSDALRIGARGTALVTVSPTFQVAIGAVYLDRDDVPVLPLGGIIWTPNPDLRLDLVAPRPKISRRMLWDCNVSHWAYVAGEFGGGAWAIERANGAEDIFYYRDYRAIVGWERTAIRGLSGRVEAGYVFGRQVDYRSQDSVDIDDTWMLRAELSY
jgi:hypothetical protein